MYTKDKACRITLRLNEEQFEFVKANADIIIMKMSVSDKIFFIIFSFFLPLWDNKLHPLDLIIALKILKVK